MDHEELVMLVGEQTLLSEERAKAQADRHSLQSKLLQTYNDITSTFGQPRWLGKAQQQLTELHATQLRLMELDTRINEIKRLTGR